VAGRFTVCRVIIFPAKVIVVHAGDIRLGGINLARHFTPAGHGYPWFFPDRCVQSAAITHGVPAFLARG
jgi:hypothetical protein